MKQPLIPSILGGVGNAKDQGEGGRDQRLFEKKSF
jgi:hypothetical protein